MRLFGRRRQGEAPTASKAKPEPLSPAALARREQEREEAEREEERKRMSAAEVEQACKQLGHWWPGEGAFERRLSGRLGRLGAALADIFRGGR